MNWRSNRFMPKSFSWLARGDRVAVPAPKEPAAFSSDDDLLEQAGYLFASRRAAAEPGPCREESADAGEALEKRREMAEAWTETWHRSFELSGDEVHLCRLCREHSLSPLEREIVVAMAMGKLGLLDEPIESCSAVARALGRREPVSVLQALSEDGALVKGKVIEYDHDEAELGERAIDFTFDLVAFLLHGGHRHGKGWTVSSEKDLFRKLRRLTNLLRRRAGDPRREREYTMAMFAMGAHMDVSFRSLAGALAEFETTLAAHPEWPVSTFFGPGWKYGPKEKFVVLALLAKDLGHFPPGDDLFMGQGLARAVIGPDETPEEVFALLKPGGRLLADGVLRPCQGWTDVLSDDDSELADVEFELTEETLRKIGLEKTHRKKASGDGAVREPRVRLEQLVLSEEVREALRMAAAQVRNMDRLMGNWGLGKVLSYGRGMTLLFSGPPGVGKTACAEALAAEIGRPILVADYSEIENCFVGQTEKNVVRLFRDAKAHGAVLFLDEAEAMFYDRETAVRSWEGRDVNVLLQQIEKFDGVCILATNLKVRLDRALARRIRLKVEFAPPDRDDRLEIWKRLLPPELPLATDVDLAELAEADLTGGEIKNAVLNAATRAVARPDGGPVTAEDFRAAVEMELRAKKERLARIGFGTRDRPDGPPGPDCGS